MSEKIKDAYEHLCRRKAQERRIREAISAAKADEIEPTDLAFASEPPKKIAEIVIKRSDGTAITINFRGEALPSTVAAD